MLVLDDWLLAPDVQSFPYGKVIEAYHEVGKHFVSKELLGALDAVRSAAGDSDPVLAAFLDTALDKWDGRYDYRTYLALGVLPLPAAQDPVRDGAAAAAGRDRLFTHLILDALEFEDAARSGRTGLFPEMRPSPQTSDKRFRLGVRAVSRAAARMGLAVPDPSGDPAAAFRELSAAASADRRDDERRSLAHSMLPVYVSHDEYLFLRILQAFETVFALLAVELTAAVGQLSDGDAEASSDRLVAAEAALRESAGLFPLLATMQVGSFQTFRLYTEGASAIQSRNYKTVEALCRVPDQPRLDSAAYLSVPELRDRVLAGQANLDDVIRSMDAAGRLLPRQRTGLIAAMDGFAATLLHWRQTHYRMAVRMLGEGRAGTGYTEGTPYLYDVRSIPVFRGTGPDGEHPDGASTEGGPR